MPKTARLKQTYKISEFRKAYDLINSIRSRFSGSARHERLREDLRTNYLKHINKLSDMIPSLQKRYDADLELSTNAIKSALAQIEWNESSQIEAIKQGESGEIFNPTTKERLALEDRH